MNDISTAPDKTETLLLVDDEAHILTSLTRLLEEEEGFEIVACTSPVEALTLLKQQPVDLVISDMRMPEMDGATFLKEVSRLYPDTPRMLLTGYADVESTIRAVNDGGISQYLSKPWDDDLLLRKIHESLEIRRLRMRNQQLLDVSEQQRKALQSLTENQDAIIKSRTAELEQTAAQLDLAYQELKESYFQSIPLLGHLIELNERYKKGHSKRVAHISRLIAESLTLNEHDVRQVFTGALLHDIGKLGLDQSIRATPTQNMNPRELQAYRQHSILGESALLSFEPLKDAAQIVRHHHERTDGKGFPDKLSGEAIPIGARIVCIANDYDNLLLPSNFLGKPLSDAQARDYVVSEASKRYDSEVVKAFVSIFPEVQKMLKSTLEATLPLDKVSPGMVLSQDLINQHGLVMLVAGSTLSQMHINKLQQFEREFDLKLMVSIVSTSNPPTN